MRHGFIFQVFSDVFRWMPVATLIEQRVFVVHGGVRADVTMDAVRKIE